MITDACRSERKKSEYKGGRKKEKHVCGRLQVLVVRGIRDERDSRRDMRGTVEIESRPEPNESGGRMMQKRRTMRAEKGFEFEAGKEGERKLFCVAGEPRHEQDKY